LLNFSGDNKTITVDGKTLPASVNQYEVDRYKLQISDSALGEKGWTIFRIWDDNGSNFTLRFEHDGKTEDLERVTS
jgi:hypothetical protein